MSIPNRKLVQILRLHLPQSTPYDPAEDPPGSVDPLGTVTGAEQLAEVLLPGLTARMWRVRLLTLAALAAEISKRASNGQNELLVDARLAFERLFVSGVAQQDVVDSSWRRGSRRLPGIGLARQAFQMGNQPLGRSNFLKGQVVNGPFGVIFRLARDVGVVNGDGELLRNGTELLLAWSQDQNLVGLLDEQSGRPGANWLKEVVRRVTFYLEDESGWPAKGWAGWEDLAGKLRLDHAGPNERRVLQKLLSQDPLGLRDRMIDSLSGKTLITLYSSAFENNESGQVERRMIADGIRQVATDDEVGVTLHRTGELIDSYESLSGVLESVFRGIVWTLTRENGQASEATVILNPILRQHLKSLRSRLAQSYRRFVGALQEFEADHLAAKRGSVDSVRMHKLLDDAETATHSDEDCITAVMNRHANVQKEKNKGVWIEQGKNWLLMPGFGDTSDEPALYDWYLHPYRITNLYGMLADLKMVPEIGTKDGEEKDE